MRSVTGVVLGGLLLLGGAGEKTAAAGEKAGTAAVGSGRGKRHPDEGELRKVQVHPGATQGKRGVEPSWRAAKGTIQGEGTGEAPGRKGQSSRRAATPHQGIVETSWRAQKHRTDTLRKEFWQFFMPVDGSSLQVHHDATPGALPVHHRIDRPGVDHMGARGAEEGSRERCEPGDIPCQKR